MDMVMRDVIGAGSADSDPHRGCGRSSSGTAADYGTGRRGDHSAGGDARAGQRRIKRIIRNRKRAYFALVRDTLEELSAEGKAAGSGPDRCGIHSVRQILWTSRWYRQDGKLTPEQAASGSG